MRVLLSLGVGLVAFVGLPAPASTAVLEAGVPTSLEVLPAKAKLFGPQAAQRLVVIGAFADGSRLDLTSSAQFKVGDSKIASVDPHGFLHPVADGKAEVVVRVGSIEASVPVEVSGAQTARRVSFRNEIQPVLTKLGCNQGACHGSQHGKGGFRLSLLGFEAEPDYTAIVKSAEGRRVTPFAPEESLLLLKPTLGVAHGGGKRMEPDSPESELIKLWLEQGAPAPTLEDPTVTGVAVFPPQRRMEPGQEQRLIAVATFSDGTTRDVTDQAKFDTLNEGVAKVGPTGLATTVGQGETNLMVRYQGHAALARVTVPFAYDKAFDFPARTILDEKVATKWRELGLVPSGLSTDAEFLRRAMLDTIGTTPTRTELEEFLADADPEKRAKLLDRLLDRPEYVDFWALKWGDLLRVDGTKLGAQGMLAFNLWLRDAFRSNKPVSAMVDELITAQGSIYTNGPANYFRVATGPDDLAETTAQVFMGVRLQCAKCHHHPFEAYGQDDYYGLAAYFARIRTKQSQEFGLFGREQVIYVAKTGEVGQPRTGKTMKPTPLGDKAADDPVDRRRALSRWLTSSTNPWLARNVVNRYWGYLLGKGLVNPIDDLRETNPPSNPDLLNTLANQFVADGFDLKKLLHLILNSRVYQLSSLPNPDNRLDTTFFTHYRIKRLTAEQLLDAINLATGTFEKFPLKPAGTRAIALPDTNYPSYFLDTFGRPERVLACECERATDPTMSQALHLMNGDLLNRKLTQADGRLTRLLRDPKLTNATLVETLYVATFNRLPSPQENEAARQLIVEAPSRAMGAQDLFWGLLNSKEFLFNH
ncbi:DUF1549 and DUF1553 domain-containing protein [Singulisphaera acidiphila]|uniref:BIG2 domain-containing protein n=1 Tax=Singulisphaera acidiphila (strain ATCC BAA-1392 / DSM 18658 / VKM B-2454 / MOB10) TaxID=886293 RepID=L0DJH2_SINAD|nr:DUF1549 and DUF1553 domain-containing protein [Singulisphaera acidiphila]AGA29534.1 Protein of unknown function (DUF1553)/Protein of unknown function (DUF1549) [Singulisphaera acidiphila DSM 18658]